MEQLEQFRERYRGINLTEVRRLIKDNADFRREVETLYVSTFHRRLNKGCTDCWLDAFVLLRKTPTEKLMAIKKRQFELRYGALLIDVVDHDDKKMASAHNLTDELALYHLRTNPKCISKFTKYPDNWQEMAAKRPRRSGRNRADKPEPAAAADAPDPAEETATAAAEADTEQKTE